jgi:hypothetical protein
LTICQHGGSDTSGQRWRRETVHERDRCKGRLTQAFFVHATQPERAAALDATLLRFAGMVRTASV